MVIEQCAMMPAQERQTSERLAAVVAMRFHPEEGYVMRLISSIRLAILGLAILAALAASSAQVLVSVSMGPPALPVYEQPYCPGEGYIWTPGYWAYGPDGYYWVPGTWVLAPEPD